jgi:hypothetical protein
MCSLSDLTIGKVIEFYDPLSHPNKHKISVIVGISNDGSDIATVYINSNINPHKLGSPELLRLQYQISPGKERPYISHVSYINCSELKHRFPSSLVDSMVYSGRIPGQLSTEDLKNVVALILSAETISPHYLRLFKIGNK